MKALSALILIISLCACSNASEYTSDNTNVVITKNPKGSGEDTSTKQLKLLAPWLDETTELEFSPTAVVGFNNTGSREVFGDFEPGTVVKMTRNKPLTIKFDVPKNTEASVVSVQIEIAQVTLKNSTRQLGQISGQQTLQFDVTNFGSISIAEYYIAPATKTAESQCELDSKLRKQADLSGSFQVCGSASDTPKTKDDDDDDDDDNDDDSGRRD
jgi:hypothetical protein